MSAYFASLKAKIVAFIAKIKVWLGVHGA